MIVDFHTHVYRREHFTERHREEEEEALRAWGKEIGSRSLEVDLDKHFGAVGVVDRAVVLGLKSTHSGWNVPNEYVAKYVNSHPEKLMGFAGIDPHDSNGIAELEHCVSDLGMCGVKLSPVYQNFDPTDERFYPFYEKVQELGIPILWHQATTYTRIAPLKHANPILLEEVALRFPELKMIIAHMGHPWEDETVAVIRKQPNVFADISALHPRPFRFYLTLINCVEYKVTHKLLFGSDYPSFTPSETIKGLSNINSVVERTDLPKIPENAIEAIIKENCKTFLRI